MQKHFLRDHDEIELGKYKLKYVAEGVRPAASADFEKTMVLRAVPGGAGVPAAPHLAPRHPRNRSR